MSQFGQAAAHVPHTNLTATRGFGTSETQIEGKEHMFSNHSAPAASRRRPFWATLRPHPAIAVMAAGATFAAAALAAAELPEAISAPGETLIVTLRAEGAQVYEC